MRKSHRLARLATEDCEKYGNRSYHKLVEVTDEYVVSSQWLEPVDIRGGGRDSSTAAHQSIAIWEAWSHKKIEQFMTRRASMLEEDEASCLVIISSTNGLGCLYCLIFLPTVTLYLENY